MSKRKRLLNALAPLALALIIALAPVACGDGDSGDDGSNDPALIGQWNLITENGVVVADEGFNIIFTSDEFLFEYDCESEGTYTTLDDDITLAISSASGFCDVAAGDSWTLKYSVTEPFLYLLDEDEDLLLSFTRR